jgi:hypothetical protein
VSEALVTPQRLDDVVQPQLPHLLTLGHQHSQNVPSFAMYGQTGSAQYAPEGCLQLGRLE